MDDSSHELGDKYLYTCGSCGYERGVLDHPYYSTRCPTCNKIYNTDKIKPKEGEIRLKPLDNFCGGGDYGNEEDVVMQTFKDGEWV